MSNDPKADLISAILALDSYNRGYGASISGLPQTGDDARLGNYSIIPGISQDGWSAAGFYGIAYQNGDQTIVSYRGTDVPLPIDSPTQGGNDPLNGYGLAFGLPGQGTVDFSLLGHTVTARATQAQLAEEFYKTVAAETLGSTIHVHTAQKGRRRVGHARSMIAAEASRELQPTRPILSPEHNPRRHVLNGGSRLRTVNAAR